jgi:hypothetical protein
MIWMAVPIFSRSGTRYALGGARHNSAVFRLNADEKGFGGRRRLN